MNYLAIENLTLHYGDKVIFEDINFYINKGDKVALVAKNGTGKTTLLKMIFGEELPSSNAKFFIHSDVKVGYLQQDTPLDETKTIREVLFSQNSEKFQAIDNYNKAMEGNYSLEDAMVAMDKLQVWDLESRMSQILGKLDIYDLDQRVGSLSGGQKKRVALSAILIEEPDLILMDEPTNHLDPEMIEWLENYLKSRELTLLVITHDRYFLDAVCNQIVELENGKMQKYAGNYAYYLDKKQLQMDILFSQNEKMKNIFRREKEWMSKQPKARTTKAKSRIDNFDTIEENTVLKPKKEELKLETVENRLGSKILEFHKAYKSFGDKKILENFEYKFKRNEKVGIVGKNGVGKTTFLNLILGIEKPDKGEVVLGETVKLGYYRQENNEFDGEKRMIEIIKDVAEHIPLKGGKSYTASQMLERFLFPGHMHYVFVKKLSGGEKRRLSLIRTLMLNPNFLILDEPTNDLDIITLNVLQEFIEEFEGCVIVISHDRYFMDNCVEHLFCFEGNGKVRDYYGTYSEYRNELLENKYNNTESKPESEKVIESKSNTAKATNKLNFNEQREFTKIEKELPKLEAEQSELSTKLTENLAFEELQKVTNRLSTIAKTMEDYNMRWLELAEKMG
ncbi:MAG: ABC-F family ATP-binding cassette domain-containing protein [Chitinophagales bacterium]|jgi:ATP-binding cassette subfamily F protein uup|nr:ABC-F family ATP-binding cassette domain-containing protein [Sphingobacteriales bacterium]